MWIGDKVGYSRAVDISRLLAWVADPVIVDFFSAH